MVPETVSGWISETLMFLEAVARVIPHIIQGVIEVLVQAEGGDALYMIDFSKAGYHKPHKESIEGRAVGAPDKRGIVRIEDRSAELDTGFSTEQEPTAVDSGAAPITEDVVTYAWAARVMIDTLLEHTSGPEATTASKPSGQEKSLCLLCQADDTLDGESQNRLWYPAKLADHMESFVHSGMEVFQRERKRDAEAHPDNLYVCPYCICALGDRWTPNTEWSSKEDETVQPVTYLALKALLDHLRAATRGHTKPKISGMDEDYI